MTTSLTSSGATRISTACCNRAPSIPSANTAFYVALLLAAFAILFGTRHLDVTEHHEGLVAAVAFESVVKLFAFLAVGIFVAYWTYAMALATLQPASCNNPNWRRCLSWARAAKGIPSGLYSFFR
ncbi:MAG: hypothetical protein R2932_16315 [Caldilineaceae bacterium]